MDLITQLIDRLSSLEDTASFTFTHRDENTFAYLELPNVPGVDLIIDKNEDCFVISNTQMFYLDHFDNYPKAYFKNGSFILTDLEDEKRISFTFN